MSKRVSVVLQGTEKMDRGNGRGDGEGGGGGGRGRCGVYLITRLCHAQKLRCPRTRQRSSKDEIWQAQGPMNGYQERPKTDRCCQRLKVLRRQTYMIQNKVKVCFTAKRVSHPTQQTLLPWTSEEQKPPHPAIAAKHPSHKKLAKHSDRSPPLESRPQNFSLVVAAPAARHDLHNAAPQRPRPQDAQA